MGLLEETSHRREQDMAMADKLRKHAKKKLKYTFLYKLLHGVNERYALKGHHHETESYAKSKRG